MAVGRHFGHAEFFFRVSKKSSGVYADMTQKFFNALMKISEIGDKINDTIGIGIPKTNLNFGFMNEHFYLL
jgi:hypothetical protein